MGFVELFMIGVGLSMDAFAVSICKGLGMRRVNWAHAAVIALFFGGFQALMPLVGWALGTQFAALITPVDHWIAFALLAFIGGKMLIDAFRGDEGGEGEGGTSSSVAAGDGELHSEASQPSFRSPAPAATAAPAKKGCDEKLNVPELFMLAIATSIDALAVGITFAFLGVNVWVAVAIIGVTTFVLSFAGVAIGNQFGSRFEKPATVVGGVVLILIGAKILLEHLGVLVF
ncbi:MAG: manganese efflux pump MntP family protein [Eggerthellaceae bacterium]|nr:manganese efflux pump MntP family protein [Eggerthellaceae bacterium]